MTAPAGVSHGFQSSKTEQSDSTLVGPNEWNNAHVFTDPVAIPSVGAPGLGSPANPAANNASLHAAQFANRDMLGCTPAIGAPFQFQPHQGRRKCREWIPRAATTTIDVTGATAGVGAGTLTARQSGPTPASLFASLNRVGLVSGATDTSIASLYDNTGYHVWRGNVAGQGGFHFIMRWGVSDAVLNANARMFAGLMSNVGLASDPGNPSSLTQILGVGCDSADTVMQLYSAGTAAQARTSLGSNFPVNTISTDIYELHLYCQPNDTKVYYTLNRFTSSQLAPAFTVSGSVTGTTAQLIAAGTMFMPYVWRAAGGTATAVAFDLFGMYCETDL